jgi:hypothetical protein
VPANARAAPGCVEGLFQRAPWCSLAQTLQDAVFDLVTCRGPMSGYDQVISKWRRQGGDQLRTEFQQAVAATKTYLVTYSRKTPLRSRPSSA